MSAVPVSVPVPDMTLRSIYKKTLQTAIDIIQDISALLSARPYTSDTEFRRKLIEIGTRPDRRLYVGLWLCFFALVVYFIDSAA
jgi:hypothetical protein